MLRPFAAVAVVPRPEDIGIDAMCTLLRPDGKFVLAENTFAIQIKSESSKPIVLKPHAYDWLNRLDVPFFLMTVNLREARARIYSFEWALANGTVPGWTELYVEKPTRSVFAPELQPWLLLEQPWGPPAVSPTEDNPQRIWLGPHIAEFTLEGLNDPAIVTTIVSLLRVWCAALTEVIYLRRSGIRYTLSWQTGSHPVPSWNETHGGDQTALSTTLERAIPLLSRIEFMLDDSNETQMIEAIASIKARAAELGIDAAQIPGIQLKFKLLPDGRLSATISRNKAT